MSEMVERVARALFEKDQSECSAWTNNVLYGQEGPISWDYVTSPEIVPHIATRFRDTARAAIEAMREPTAKMLDAGSSLDWGPALATENEAMPHSCWQAMLDAALSG